MEAKQSIDEWMKENTFECPALRARISLQQCEEIRKRPTIKEYANNNSDGFKVHVKNCRPDACDTCTVWKEFAEQRQCKCKECGKAFKPYVNGAITITTICEHCLKKKRSLNIRISKQNKENTCEKKEKKNPKLHSHILWDLLTSEEELFLALQEKAKEEVRTLEQQIIYELKRGILRHESL